MEEQIDPLSRYAKNVKPDMTWWQAGLAVILFVGCMIFIEKVVMPHVPQFQRAGEQTRILEEP